MDAQWNFSFLNSGSHLFPAREEALHILQRFGDSAPKVDKSSVMGIAIAHATLDNRQVTNQCRALFRAEPVLNT